MINQLEITMRSTLKIIALATVASLGFASTAHAYFVDTSPDGAKYTVSWTNVGSLYTFTYTADFTGAAGSAALGDYAMAISLASQPGSVNWSAGTISAAPGTEANWGIYQGVVTNSNGCPTGGAADKDWCIGLSGSSNDGPQITTSSVLTWMFTMNLVSGTPDFDGDPAWSYKFVSTTGNYDARKGEWEFGNYQISRTLGVGDDDDLDVPEPGTLALLGLGLLGLGMSRRRVAK
ncbi:MAG: PEP-CTERM sorting domain-containing protein [Woeseiaceae bacterium]|nr:PEP-CTERM sorting domain-containing protein [Woeseiaceae bacterium]